MKRVVLLVALCVAASSASFAQKKAVSDAQSIAKSDKADFNEARNLIKGALANDETKNDAKTWYVAGFVEDQAFSAERTKQILGQKPDEPKMYEALYGVLPYFKKSYELDQLPDVKGKVKPKFSKDIKSILGADHSYYFNAGAYYYDKHEFAKAIDGFEQYIEIANMPMFAGTKTAERDSTYMTVQFYSAIAAIQLNDAKLAIEKLTRAKDFPYRQNDVYQYLAYECDQAKDTVAMEKYLEEGYSKSFAEDTTDYYLLSLINLYITSGRDEKALSYLDKAIEKKPTNANLYNVKGRVYEDQKDFEKALTMFNKALEIDPNLTDALSNVGRIYYNQAVNKLSDANGITDNTKYKAAKDDALKLFKQALPFFEKAHTDKPDEMEYMIALRGIYYNLDMGDKLKDIEAKMGANK